ncbi:MAG: hypothetical protein A3A28_03905 [Candidatus Sungbacteria bacterium RIFCSPLOWO2_01_FULL_47_32]|uniref:Uncharacterized protein n=1 Tax=Candidatus Sungbacteria bacterium RIFCSPHIGHO2_01_FULL_47_32 TaxID=1802264 RepID=A0A1G2K1W3_9BACT|nr:MAG: hypothetical protein UX72_C0039G0022 [Parcubacteria group bacterium GW2011_GWA2_47_10]OGZ93414.1 MAG: hypothetical protein A2633_01675 [Candidatus Sungbacteria bacterium RIFCSPHIGHO2_01_FULL_47_32]OGZ99835.1 MAG: hypothetical protein A3D57_01240 [Candidatus Sungbacteria bacterium RIFCSPHIGHO2_02_FULL_46_12]OHA05052.1 MAG: hypothetical protein A3A28_03905 [Candidatus Sungbacteria bacterium RIFCSPLOWO2_01_FULL_47_32]
MARRNGEVVDLWDETLFYLKGLPSGATLNEFLLRDFLDGCRGNEFSEKEFNAVVNRLQDTYKMKVPEGSLGESIKSVTTTELQSQEKTKRDRKSKGYSYFSKLDELELDS